jgi:hypothetical protein
VGGIALGQKSSGVKNQKKWQKWQLLQKNLGVGSRKNEEKKLSQLSQ